jgi:hypothetical protein
MPTTALRRTRASTYEQTGSGRLPKSAAGISSTRLVSRGGGATLHDQHWRAMATHECIAGVRSVDGHRQAARPREPQPYGLAHTSRALVEQLSELFGRAALTSSVRCRASFRSGGWLSAAAGSHPQDADRALRTDPVPPLVRQYRLANLVATATAVPAAARAIAVPPLLVAARAIDGFGASGLEGHLCLVTTARTRHTEQLPSAAVASGRVAAARGRPVATAVRSGVSLRLPSCPAIGATRRLTEPATRVELLFT